MRRAQYWTGAVLWLLSIQYYVTQLVVAAAWPNNNGYSWASNTISDLANTECGPYGTRLVCSPLYASMNISFLLLGVTMIGGAYLLARQLSKNIVAYVGFSFMALAGIGTILVGLFPENTVSSMHVFGAALPFVFGNIAMILFGYSLWSLKAWLRLVTAGFGVVGLGALILFMTHAYFGLGIGGMERIVAYPQSIWMILFGAYLLWKRPHLI